MPSCLWGPSSQGRLRPQLLAWAEFTPTVTSQAATPEIISLQQGGKRPSFTSPPTPQSPLGFGDVYSTPGPGPRRNSYSDFSIAPCS